MMRRKDIEDVLRKIDKDLSKTPLNWAVCGSANLKLSGIEIDVDDVDVIVLLPYLGLASHKILQTTALTRIDNPILGKEVWECKFADIHLIGASPDDVYANALTYGGCRLLDTGEGRRVQSVELATEWFAYNRRKLPGIAKKISEFMQRR